ncbi:hypothetical protein L484_018204 [Morus notabilis]|uniref:Uncharacterized protein n=1 Tax=Morus notabilis TaxID=981085 RepID=W9QFJ1_9ROSA|nr:hypothetical protein L484_018204 [Morus notabilis]
MNVGAMIQSAINHVVRNNNVGLAVPCLITESREAAGVSTIDDSAILQPMRPLDRYGIHRIWNNQNEEAKVEE